MSKKKQIDCHDCSSSTKVIDKDEEYEVDDLKYCPFCGSENIESSEELK